MSDTDGGGRSRDRADRRAGPPPARGRRPGRAGPPARGGPPARRGGGQPPPQGGRRAQAGPRPRGAPARDQGPAGPGGGAEREAELHAAGGARAHRRAPRRGGQAHPAAVRLRRGGRQERRRHRRRALQRPQDAGRTSTPTSRPTSSTAAPRWPSTRASTSSSPGRPSAAARSSPSRRSWRTACGRSSSGGPTRSGCASWPTPCAAPTCAPATRCSWTPGPGCCWRSCPGPRSRTCCSRRCPTSATSDIGGLDTQIEEIADAVELPFLHQELFAEHRLPAPKGILLYGPPGCGKTLIAKAVANSLAKKVADKTGDAKGRSYFINIKGPELLNKYVGETERQIRLVFQRAREKSEEGWPVIVFFDEMDSMFRTRGSGISLGHGVHDRAAAPGRDRRRGGAAQRHRDRGHEPRGPDRPRHPPPRPAGREDQDRAAERGRGPADLRPLPDVRDPAGRRRGRRARRGRRRRRGAEDDRVDGDGDVPGGRRTTGSSRSPTPTATRRSSSTRTSRPAP